MLHGGLSSEAARARLAQDGPNVLPEEGRKGLVGILGEVLREPMLALLVAGGAVYLLIGELHDALILVGFALFSVIVTLVQELRTERVLSSLRALTTPLALVVRDGSPQRLPSSEIVVGDIVLLQEGDRVPADAALLEASELQIDESLLTGESVPVTKRARCAGDPERARPGGDDLPFAFSGTLIVRGQGAGEVIATSARSEIGRIGKSLAELDTEPPRLQQETRWLTINTAVLGAAISLLLVLLYGLLRDNWLNAILAGIALGMSMLPEEFPVVLTVFMVMGAWRISRANVLARRATAIEALGSATVLCTDKTGTLTENRMVVAEMRLPDGQVIRPGGAMPLPAGFAAIARAGVQASAQQPFDPMDRAFHDLGEPVPPTWSLARCYGLSAELLAVVQVWNVEGEGNRRVAAKGAPEAIAALCRLEGDRLEVLRNAVSEMAAGGLRVLGVATATQTTEILPESPCSFGFSFAGLVGLSDPLRPSVPAAVAECRAAGVRIVMITGDHPETARAIARAAGLDASPVRSGAEVAAMNDEVLTEAVRSTSIFSRILPEQKLRIVEALKRNGEVVAMTGDGVNDAPSLKAADIGIAMGRRGTDVAREAAGVVLLDDDFGSIVKAIRLGRRIYDNLRKAMSFIIAVHMPVAGLALIPLLTGLPIVLWPVHIALIEMIIDPVCSLAFEAEPEEPGIMRRPPRSPQAKLLPRWLLAWGAAQGAVALTLVLAVFAGGHLWGLPDDQLRALTFFTLVSTVFALILANRSFSASLLRMVMRPSPALLVVVVATVAILAISLLWPAAAGLFGFGPLHADDFGIAAGAGVAVLLVLELGKTKAGRQLRREP